CATTSRRRLNASAYARINSGWPTAASACFSTMFAERREAGRSRMPDAMAPEPRHLIGESTQSLGPHAFPAGRQQIRPDLDDEAAGPSEPPGAEGCLQGMYLNSKSPTSTRSPLRTPAR